jgi:hypothetical protein
MSELVEIWYLDYLEVSLLICIVRFQKKLLIWSIKKSKSPKFGTKTFLETLK